MEDAYYRIKQISKDIRDASNALDMARSKVADFRQMIIMGSVLANDEAAKMEEALEEACPAIPEQFAVPPEHLAAALVVEKYMKAKGYEEVSIGYGDGYCKHVEIGEHKARIVIVSKDEGGAYRSPARVDSPCTAILVLGRADGAYSDAPRREWNGDTLEEAYRAATQWVYSTQHLPAPDNVLVETASEDRERIWWGTLSEFLEDNDPDHLPIPIDTSTGTRIDVPTEMWGAIYDWIRERERAPLVFGGGAMAVTVLRRIETGGDDD